MSVSNPPSGAARLEDPPGHVRLGRSPKRVGGSRSRCHLGGDWPSDPGDEEILDRAHRDARILVTLDKDFGELAIVHGRPHSGIVRLVALSTLQQVAVCLAVLATYAPYLEGGAIVTAEANRIRLRPADDDRD